MKLLDLQKLVPKSEDWIEAKDLTRGASSDRKFRIKDAAGRKYMLRLASEDRYESKKEIFERMRLAFSADIPMIEPIDFGKAEDGTVYQLFSWLEGIDADTHIGALSEEEQYAFGIEIGKIQKKLHASPVREAEKFDWYEKMVKEKADVLDWVESCGIKIDHLDEILSCINESFDLMRSRPITLAHGDYQISNFLIMPDGHAGIIDFDFIRYSDPMQETQALTIYTRSYSSIVAAGQVDGYCDNAPTPEFWRLVKFYLAFNLLTGLRWWADGPESGIRHFSNIIRMCLADYDTFKRDIPKWYTDWKSR